MIFFQLYFATKVKWICLRWFMVFQHFSDILKIGDAFATVVQLSQFINHRNVNAQQMFTVEHLLKIKCWHRRSQAFHNIWPRWCMCVFCRLWKCTNALGCRFYVDRGKRNAAPVWFVSEILTQKSEIMKNGHLHQHKHIIWKRFAWAESIKRCRNDNITDLTARLPYCNCIDKNSVK